jgi:flagellin
VQAKKGKQGETPMALTVLNNISSMTAENALSNTQANLQKTLTQLSTGMKINSGSDDAAGLSIVSGLNANIAALTQSQQNAANGAGLLQTADGALAQVTTLLNRAVTLATEASTSGITTGAGSQADALNTEFSSILSEINQIGAATNFNGSNVFGTASVQGSVATGKSVESSQALSTGSTITITDTTTGKSLAITQGTTASLATETGTTGNYTATSATAADLNTAIATAFGGNLTTTVGTDTAAANEVISSTTDNFTIASTDTGVLGTTPTMSLSTETAGTAKVADVYIGDGTTAAGANTQIDTSINGLSATDLGLNSDNLSTASAAQTALAHITLAINTVSAQRGVIGASVNRLTAATGDMSSEVTNLQSAANGLSNADIGKTVANMTQYNVLQSTGMAALQQSNQAQQAVLKLVQ